MEQINAIANLMISFRNKDALLLSLSDLCKQNNKSVVNIGNSLKELKPLYDGRVKKHTKQKKRSSFSALNEKISSELEKLREPYDDAFPQKTLEHCKFISDSLNNSENGMTESHYKQIIIDLKRMENNITFIPLIVHKVRTDFYQHLEKNIKNRDYIASEFNISKRSLENYASFGRIINKYPQLTRTNLSFTNLITHKTYIEKKISNDPDLDMMCRRPVV